MNRKKYTKVFIWAFLLLYFLVAAISFCHAVEFFTIGNVQWMAVTLAFAFELGLAVCLASILLGTNKDNTVVWILLVVLVIVQVCGNTYSVFKYISLSETEYYQYLAKPLLFFIEEVSRETVQIIIAWIMGAILPIVALLMTEMVSKQIKDLDDSKIGENDERVMESDVVPNVEQELVDKQEEIHEETPEEQSETNEEIFPLKKEDDKISHKTKITQVGPIQKPKPDIEHYNEKRRVN